MDRDAIDVTATLSFYVEFIISWASDRGLTGKT